MFPSLTQVATFAACVAKSTYPSCQDATPTCSVSNRIQATPTPTVAGSNFGVYPMTIA